VKKKILSTILLITIVAFGVFVSFRIFKKQSEEAKTTEKVEKMVEIGNKSNENVNIEEENEEIIVEKEEEAITEVIEEKPKNNNSSASNNKTSQSTKTSDSKKTESKNTTNQKQEVKTETKVETKTSEKKKEQPSSTSTPKPETIKPVEEKKEEEKTKEVVVEVPDSKSYKDDPAFIKLQNELFRTFKECNDAGEKEWRKDSDNVSNIYCEAEYYKGAEAGIRLYIVYNDKTWKKYSK
jgi:cell division protein FtsN